MVNASATALDARMTAAPTAAVALVEQHADEIGHGQALKLGESVIGDFATVGRYDYISTFHPPDMQVTVQVDAAREIDPGLSSSNRSRTR
jgi:plastocyanin